MATVSVIIPVYNNAETIGRAIESVQKQSMRDVEIVVVDDASTDKTHEVVTALAAQDPRITLFRLPRNLGAGGARNVAIDNATSTWIAILDADDWFEPNRLEMLVKVGEESTAAVVLDNLQIYDHAKSMVFEKTRHGMKSGPMLITAEAYFQHDNPLHRHVYGLLKPMVRRAFLAQHKIAYDPDHRTGQDFVFLAEIILQGGKALLIPEAYYIYVRRISPTTRKISPHSRSGINYASIVRGCDELMQKYGNVMTPAARRALMRRRYLFRIRLAFQQMLTELHERHLSKAVLVFIEQPAIIIFFISALFRRLQTNIMSGQHRLTKPLTISR